MDRHNSRVEDCSQPKPETCNTVPQEHCNPPSCEPKPQEHCNPPVVETCKPTVDLCITKNDCKGTAVPGTENVYTITITNNGPSEINSLTLCDTNPKLFNLTFENPSIGSFNSQTGEWSGISLGHCETITIDVKGTVDPTLSCGTLTNCVKVTVPECVINTGDSSASDTDKIVPVVDLQVTKDDGKCEAIPGTENIYKITITNNGPSEINSVHLTDINPILQNVCFQNASKGEFNHQTGEWSCLNLGKGDTVCIEVKGDIPADAKCGELTNVVKVCVPECVVNIGDSRASDTDKLVPTVDLCVTKDDGKCEAIPGTENVYKITITNNGPSEIDSLKLTDCNPILQNVCFENASKGEFNHQTGEWSCLNLGKGDTVCIEVKGYIPADADCGELTNVIKVEVPECVVNKGDSSASDTDKLVPTVDLCVTKDDGKCEAIPGTENVYKITITNHGPSEIDTVRLFDCNPLLKNICFQNESKGHFDKVSGNWSGLELGCGDKVCIEVKGYIPADAPCGELTNVIKVQVPECVVNKGDSCASDTDKLVPTVDLCVTKDDGKCEVVPGEVNVYKVTITNNGPSEIHSLHLSDVNPLLKNIKFQHPSEGHFSNKTGEWTGLDLGKGDTVCIEVKGYVPKDAPCGELTNVVKVCVPECVVNNGDSCASDTDKVVHPVDLTVTKDDGKCEAIPGTENVYKITITNNGPFELDSVRLTDCNPLLQNVCFQNASKGEFNHQTGEWSCLNLGKGETVCIEVKGYIPADAECGELTNVIKVDVPECNINLGDKSASDTDQLVPTVNLCVTKDDGKCEAIPGTENCYKVTITNNGPSEIDSLKLTDCNPILQNVCFQNASKGEFNHQTGEWSCLNLGKGETVCIEVKGYIPADAECGELTNVIKVEVPECVVNQGDSSASDTDQLVPTVDLCITKDDGKCEAIPGTENVYKITITNNGPSELDSLRISDCNPLLENITFQNASKGCFDANTGNWTGLELGHGDKVCIEVKGTICADADCGELTNVVKVSLPECVVNKGDSSASDTDKLVPTVDLCITNDDGKCETKQGAENVYKITITNNGPSEIDSLQLSDCNPQLQCIKFKNPSEGCIDPQTGHWTGLELGQGDTVCVEVQGKVDPEACGTLTNVVSVCVPKCVVNTGDTSASDTDVIKEKHHNNEGNQCSGDNNEHEKGHKDKCDGDKDHRGGDKENGNQCSGDNKEHEKGQKDDCDGDKDHYKGNQEGNHCGLGSEPPITIFPTSCGDSNESLIGKDGHGIWHGGDNDQKDNDSECVRLGSLPPQNTIGICEVIDSSANGSEGDKCKPNLTTLLDSICQSNKSSSNGGEAVCGTNVGKESQSDGQSSTCGQPNSTFCNSTNNDVRNFEFHATSTAQTSGGE